MAVFVLGGFLAGLSGVLYVSWGNFITPDVFGVTAAILPVLWVTVGGAESIVASAIAATCLSWLTLYLGTQGNLSNVVVGALLILVAVTARRGLGPTLAMGVRAALSSGYFRRSGGGVGLKSEGHTAHTRDVEEAGTVAHVTQERAAFAPLAQARGPVLEVRGVCKAWRGVKALSDVSFSVGAGEVLCIIGPNGAGKSTLLKCITGDVSPEEGEVLLGANNIVRTQKHTRARSGIGIKYQNGGVYTSLTVSENFELAFRGPARRNSDKDTAPPGKTHDAPSHVSRLPPEIRWIYEQKGDVRLGDLPHGEQQLVEIGMALECAPQLLILDEPVAGLSVSESALSAELIKSLAKRYGTAIIVTEHDMEFVRQLDAPLIVLHHGQVLARGSYEEIMTLEEVRSVYLGVEDETSDDRGNPDIMEKVRTASDHK